MRLIPGKTKVSMELFKGVRLSDMIVGVVQVLLLIFILTSTIPYKLVIGIVVFLFSVILIARIDELPNYLYILNIIRHFGYHRQYKRNVTDEELAGQKSSKGKDKAFSKVFDDKKSGSKSGKGAADAKSSKKPEKKDLLDRLIDLLFGSKDAPAKKKDEKAEEAEASDSSSDAPAEAAESAAEAGEDAPSAEASEPEAETEVETEVETEAETETPAEEVGESETPAEEPAGAETPETETGTADAAEEKPQAPVKETKAQKKKREKQEQKEREEKRKKEDKILKDPNAPQSEKDAIREERAARSAEAAKKIAEAKEATTKRCPISDLIAFTDIQDDMIIYDGKYFGIAIEIPSVEFRFFSPIRRINSVENALGRVLRALPPDYAANIVKIERPVIYDHYALNEENKLEELKRSYESGFVSEAEMQARVEVLYDRMDELKRFRTEEQVVEPFYYLVLFDNDRKQLTNTVTAALDFLRGGELQAHRLNSKELAVFLKYTNQIDFDERDVDKIDPADYADWAMPKKVDVKARTVVVNDIITHNLRTVNYPSVVDDAWMAGLMSIPGTKVVMKLSPMDRTKSIRGIDHSLQELRERFAATGVDSKRIELSNHIETLSTLLAMLQGENECLLECNVYVTAYDIALTRANTSMVQPPKSMLSKITSMKKAIRRTYQEAGFRLNIMEFNQMEAFIGGQVSGYDPMKGQGRGIPSNTAAAAYPWIYSHISDEKGVKLGSSDGVPVFVDFFRRDSERVNSNMVIVGKSGSGKSFATKTILTNLAADDSKIFILDPENEYMDLAANLHGKFINVGNATYGRLNPFHIITALDDEESDGESDGNSYSTHLQFLEEFFRQILPDCDKDAMEYLNSLIDRMYTNKGITPETNLTELMPEDYPIFDDLYDTILEEFQSTDNEYIRTMLRTLMNYVSKFATGGRNSTIWNGPSSVTTEENFTVFNFQSLLANRNGTVANAQMLLVLKYIDNEIIKNREYNTKFGLHRKIVVVIDEAHVFIDTKFPVALDFMFQLAKRIRKYNGMQIVITQNIKDFVGSEEIARKSTAIINACQYSFIFALAPNDMDDLCRLYEKAGGINENEQEQIVSASRGQAFTIMSSQSRSSFKVEVPANVRKMFSRQGYVSPRFSTEIGAADWEHFIAPSRKIRDESGVLDKRELQPAPEVQERKRPKVSFMEMTEEEFKASAGEEKSFTPRVPDFRPIIPADDLEDEDFDIPEIPDDPAAFRAIAEKKTAPAVPQVPAAPVAPVTPAAAPIYQAPAIQPMPQVVVQAPASNPDLERVLDQLSSMMENVSKLSYDSMIREMQRMIQDSPAAAAVPMPAAAVPAPAPVPKTVSSLDLFDDLDEEVSGGSDLFDGFEIVGEESDSAVEDETNDFLDMFDFDDEEEEKPKSSGASLGSIFNEDAMREAARLNALEAGEGVDLDFDFLGDTETLGEDEDDFDIMSMLSEEAEVLNEMTPIEMMLVYGENVIEITLEELAAYNRKNH